MDNQYQLKRTAILVAIIQLFFFSSWVVFITYLGGLLEQVGLGKDLLIRFLIIVHLMLVLSDTAMGYVADRMDRAMGFLGPAIVAINALSCLAFILLPFVASTGDGDSLLMKTLFIALILIWVFTSSALRAPPLVLLLKHTTQSAAPLLTALSLFGLALGGGLSSFLATFVKDIDPSIPFLTTGLILFVVSTGLIYMQTLVTRMPKTPLTQSEVEKPLAISAISLLLISGLLLALGFQLHYFLNSNIQYQQFLNNEKLDRFTPLFWIAFILTLYPAAIAAKHFSTIKTMAFATVLGGFGFIMAGLTKALTILIIAQMLIGAAWGIILIGGISAALGLGRTGREGLVLGLWFSMLSTAALVRILIAPSGLGEHGLFQAIQNQLPLALWLMGSVLLIVLVIFNAETLQHRKI